jgi:hypothetical protein
MSATRKLWIGLATLLIVSLLFLSTVAIGLLYGAGLMWFVFRLWMPARREPVTMGPTAPAAR